MCIDTHDIAVDRKRTVSEIVAHSALPSFSISGLEHRTLVSKHTGATSIELWEDVIYPGAATPNWWHDCEVAITVLIGTGEFRSNGNSVLFNAPCSWRVPTNTQYQVINTDQNNLVLLTALSSGDPRTSIDDQTQLQLPWQSQDCAQSVSA
jgi:quercetin dioxygenase-like cupin family protein